MSSWVKSIHGDFNVQLSSDAARGPDPGSCGDRDRADRHLGRLGDQQFHFALRFRGAGDELAGGGGHAAGDAIAGTGDQL